MASRDENTGETTYKPVTQLFVNQNKVVLNLTLIDSDGNTETLGVTEEHPFWIEGKQWVNAADLRAGDRVVTLKGKAQTVHAIDVDAQRHTTYNFEVAEFHTYFVGEHGVWVHNMCDKDRATMRENTHHIYDPKKKDKGHIAPKTEASKKRANELFENIASNPENRRPDLEAARPDKQRAGIEMHTQDFRNGQGWTETRNGVIQDAGVNRGNKRK